MEERENEIVQDLMQQIMIDPNLLGPEPRINIQPITRIWEHKVDRLCAINNWVIVGISGITNSGKTTLCNRLAEMFTVPGLSYAATLHQDQFFRDEDDSMHVWVPLGEKRKHQNWELMDCINWNLMCRKLELVVGDIRDEPRCILFVDGHIIFNFRPIANVCHRRYFIELEDKKTVLDRRIERNYIPPDPPGYFETVVWPMYFHNKEEIKRNPKVKDNLVTVDGKMNAEEMAHFVYRELDDFLAHNDVHADIPIHHLDPNADLLLELDDDAEES